MLPLRIPPIVIQVFSRIWFLKISFLTPLCVPVALRHVNECSMLDKVLATLLIKTIRVIST